MLKPPICIPPVVIKVASRQIAVGAGSAWTAACRLSWWPRQATALRSPASTMHRKRSPRACVSSADWRSHCPARRKDQSIGVRQLHDWRATIATFGTSGATSYIRFRTDWSETHDRLVIENLHVSGLLRNHHLALAISDAGWTEFARQLRYKAEWRGGEIAIAERWYPSSQICSCCGTRNHGMKLADRVFTCSCGLKMDRDSNAAANLAQWAEGLEASSNPRTRKQSGRVTKARRREGADRRRARVGETSPNDAGTDVRAAPAT